MKQAAGEQMGPSETEIQVKIKENDNYNSIMTNIFTVSFCSWALGRDWIWLRVSDVPEPTRHPEPANRVYVKLKTVMRRHRIIEAILLVAKA